VPTPDFDLYLVTDRSLTQGRDLLWVLQQALDGGVEAIQLREKDLGGRELFFLAEAVRKLTRRYHARLLINDRIDIALAVEADGVQLATNSLPIETARSLLGQQAIIGASTHSLNEAAKAERNGADFILFGPVYFTPSKAPYGVPQGLAALKKVVEKISLPIYAIGGIKPENIADARRAGVRGVALISAVMSAADPRDATKKILNLLKR
jgi:thiamine-phosphate pyrophosphorylase